MNKQYHISPRHGAKLFKWFGGFGATYYMGADNTCLISAAEKDVAEYIRTSVVLLANTYPQGCDDILVITLRPKFNAMRPDAETINVWCNIANEDVSRSIFRQLETYDNEYVTLCIPREIIWAALMALIMYMCFMIMLTLSLYFTHANDPFAFYCVFVTIFMVIYLNYLSKKVCHDIKYLHIA
jgi:hypothetical protein